MKTLIAIEIQEEGYTLSELRAELSRIEGRSIPTSTLKDWLTKACLLSLKPIYTQDDFIAICRWVAWKNRRSRIRVQDYHNYLRQFIQEKNNESDTRTGSAA